MIGQGRRTVRLWDGREYPAAAVQDISPELCDYAKTHYRLHEWLSVGLPRILREYLLLFVVGLFLAETAMLLASIYTLRILEFPTEFMIRAFVWTVIVFAAYLPLWVLPSLLDGPIKLSVENGEVTLQFGCGSRFRRATAPLAACEFYLAPIRFRDRLRTVRRTDGYLILLVPRKSAAGRLWRWRPFACGFTPRKGEIWLAFFKMVGVKQLVPRIYAPVI